MIEFKFHVATVVTDLKKAGTLIESSKRLDIPVLNLGKNLPWQGDDLRKREGRLKVNLMKNFLSALDDNRIILFVNGCDILINANTSEIVKKFIDQKVDILFGAEKSWRFDKSLASQFPETETGYRYLYSDVYIGFSASLKKFFSEPFADVDNDKDYMTESYIKNLHPDGDLNIAIDKKATIFQCASESVDDIVIVNEKRFFNKKTNSLPCILHGNGDPADQHDFTKICASLELAQDQVHFSPTNGQFDVIGPEIIMTDFLTPTECMKLITMAEEFGEWKSMYGDKFPGQEMRLRILDPNLFDRLEAHFAEDLNKIIEKYWWPMRMHGLRDAFIIKYSPETQASLACHTDASMVSGIVKLNADYEGGETWFYRQQFSTKYAPVGKMILWPGQVTHGHEGREVTAGTKYSLIIWTSRTNNDLNY